MELESSNNNFMRYFESHIESMHLITAAGFLNNKMGRSVSHGGLPRGGGRMGRRTSMAF